MNLSSFVDSPAWTIAGWSLLHYLWVGALLGGVAWTLKRAVRPLAPQARYAVAVVMFVMLAVAPPVVAWRVATQPTTVTAGDYPTIAPATTLSLDESARARMVIAPRLSDHAFSADVAMTPPVETIEAFVVRHCTNVLAVCVQWAPAVWLFGMPLTLAFLATGLFGAERLRQRSSPLADGPIPDAVRRWAEALRITRQVAIGVSDRVVAPLVIGVVRPMIVLPASIVARQSPEQMEMILLHELAHVRRADNLVNLFQRVVEAVLFFQPAVWFVSRWVRLEREHCCDIVVLSYTGDPQGYAETLASLAMPGISPAYAAAAMANHQLVSRIQHILSSEEQTMSLSPKLAALAGAICLVAGLSLSGAAQQATRAEGAVDEPKTQVADQAEAPAVELSLDAGVASSPADGEPTLTHDYLALAAQIQDSNVKESGASGTLAQSNDVAKAQAQFLRQIGLNFEKRAWGTEQATGAPDVVNAGDSANAWASLSEDEQDEWLELSYGEPVEVIAVQIFANYNPGAVARVTVFDAETAGLQYTWQGEDPVKASGPRARGVSIITIPAAIKADRVRIEIASKSVAGWNEIDAVGLLDASGKTHWATKASASTTYADRPMATNDDVGSQLQHEFYRLAIAATDNALAEQGRASGTLALIQGQQAQSQWRDLMRARAANSALDVRDWSPDQATGAPADLGAAEQNDRRHAWRPAKPDAGREMLNVMYDTPVKAKLLLIYEMGVPGVDVVTCLGENGEVRGRSRDLKVHKESCVLSIPLDGKWPITSVRLGLDTAAVKGWTDIDAVGLIDEEGKVHWANRAKATSTHADVADAAMSSADRGAEWLRAHSEHTRNVACNSCHAESTGSEPGGDRLLKSGRVKVSDLLDKSDADLREWLKKHGAANIRIEADGTATVGGTFDVYLGERIQGQPEQDASHAENPAAAEAKAEYAKARLALDRAAATERDLAAEKQRADIAAKRLVEFQRAYEAEAAALQRRELRARIEEKTRRVEIALVAGEKGSFSRPGRRFVRAERVEAPGAKNILTVTITEDGLEFLGGEPGAGLIRCWDQQGGMIEVEVHVKAKTPPQPEGAAELEPTEKPMAPPMPAKGESSKSELDTKIDRLIVDSLARKPDPNVEARATARRVYLDVLGVPPTADEVDAFVGDGKPETIEKSVRELFKRIDVKPAPEQ